MATETDVPPYDDDHPTFSTRRLEAYSDGVFAIAATLLVLDLSLDQLGLGSDRDSVTANQIWQALGDNWQSFLSFALSFLILGILWGVHLRTFELVSRVDDTVITLNTFRLLGVVLVPFTTSLNSEYTFTVPGMILLPVNFFYIIAITTWQWVHLASPKRKLLDPTMPRIRIEAATMGTWVALVTAAFVVVFSFFIGSWAFMLFFVSGFVQDALHRRAKRRSLGAHPPAS